MRRETTAVTPAKAKAQNYGGRWTPAFAGVTPLAGVTTLAAMTAFLFLLSTPARAGTGQTAGILLQEPFGARPYALGQAYTALGDDVYAMGYNPASLSRMRESQAATQFTQSLADTRLGYFGFATPINPTQALGASVAFLDAGTAQIFDATGAQTGSVSAERDFLIQLVYSRGISLAEGRLNLGTGAKVLHSTIADAIQTTAYAFDAGALYEAPLGPGSASFGAALQNIGPGVHYSGGLADPSRSMPLPMTARIGLGYGSRVFSGDALSVGAQFDRLFGDQKSFESLGVEYAYHNLLALRAGWRIGQDTGGLTMGLGLKVKSISVDYAFGLMQTLNNVHQISLNYRFTIPGIQYNRNAPPSPLETMVEKARKDIGNRRFFDARAEVERIQTFFPESDQASVIKSQIDRQVDQLMITSPETSPNTLDARLQPGGTVEYNYALGFRKYYSGSWSDAAAALDRASRLEPDNGEIQSYLKKARKNAADQQKQTQLERGARIATLFDLANQAFEDGDYAKAEWLVAEIERLGPYGPADSLRTRIEKAREKPRIAAPQPKPAPKPAVKMEAPEPTASDISRAEETYYQAVRLYADGDLDGALKKLYAAIKLNPANETIRNTLERVERQAKERQKASREIP